MSAGVAPAAQGAVEQARARFAECFRIVEKGLSGEPFTHDGTFWKIERPIRLRPEPGPKKVRFYGAIGSPASAEVMGDLGIPPICLSTFPDGLLVKILDRWRARAGANCMASKMVFNVRLTIRLEPLFTLMPSRNDGRKDRAETLTRYMPGMISTMS